jgi:hypothetical protein
MNGCFYSALARWIFQNVEKSQKLSRDVVKRMASLWSFGSDITDAHFNGTAVRGGGASHQNRSNVREMERARQFQPG